MMALYLKHRITCCVSLGLIVAAFGFSANAGDLAITKDIAPSQDISFDQDPFYKPQVSRQKAKKLPSNALQTQEEDLLPRQMDSSATGREAQQTYIQNQENSAQQAATIVIPEGTIPGVQGPITITPQAGN
jgi:hypothetical protein